MAIKFQRGDLYDALAAIGPASSGQLAKHCGLKIGTVSKLMSVMLLDGNILANGRAKDGRMYRINPEGKPPIDKRNEPKPRKHNYKTLSYDTSRPWLAAVWEYFPTGPESQYCARLDALRGEVCPEFAKAAE